MNEALDVDKLESGGVRGSSNIFPLSLIRRQILQVSIYVNLNDIPKISFGRRSTVYPGTADLNDLVEKEVAFNGELQDIRIRGPPSGLTSSTNPQGYSRMGRKQS